MTATTALASAKANTDTLLDLASRINAGHVAAEQFAKEAIFRALDAGRALLEAKRKIGHGRFGEWVAEHVTCTPRTCQRYIKLAKGWNRISEKRHVSDLSVSEALRLVDGNVQHRSESEEWYTPKSIVERVVAVLGEIDLDPCSNSATEPNIPARRRYTKDMDGLTQEWGGKVFLNPPYGKTIGQWINRLVVEYEADSLSVASVTEAIALIPARADAKWFRQLRRWPRCFIFGRLKFENASTSAPFPSVAVYLGPNVEHFARVFGEIGDVVVDWRPKALHVPQQSGEGADRETTQPAAWGSFEAATQLQRRVEWCAKRWPRDGARLADVLRSLADRADEMLPEPLALEVVGA